jgi:hypothetical protein
MLPDFRFWIGAVLATAILAAAAIGPISGLRLTHQPPLARIEVSRNLAFADRFERPPPTDLERIRRFEDMARQIEAGHRPTGGPQAAAPQPPEVDHPPAAGPGEIDPPADRSGQNPPAAIELVLEAPAVAKDVAAEAVAGPPPAAAVAEAIVAVDAARSPGPPEVPPPAPIRLASVDRVATESIPAASQPQRAFRAPGVKRHVLRSQPRAQLVRQRLVRPISWFQPNFPQSVRPSGLPTRGDAPPN